MKIQNRTKHNNKNHYGLSNQKRYITIHDTGNTSRGANAEMHARYIANGSKETWHYTVDDRGAIQHFSHDTQCWHAGDGRGSGNLHSIGIEICINQDGNYKKAIDNAVKLVQKLMKDLNIPYNHIVQHNKWSGKDCPKQIRRGKDAITWKKFNNLIQKKQPIITTSVKHSPTKITVDGYLGRNTVSALQTYFGLVVDGEIWGQYHGNQATKAFNQRAVKYGKGGSPVVKALQRKISASPVDGIWGTGTTRALQRYLGTPVDGEIWRPSRVIKELQKRLNNGKL